MRAYLTFTTYLVINFKKCLTENDMLAYTKFMKSYRNTDPPIDFFNNNSSTPFYTHTTSYGDEYSYHTHNFYEIVYIKSGEINHVINDVPQKLKFGHVIFLRPTDRHVYIRTDKECSHRDLIFENKFFEETCALLNPNFLTNYLASKAPTPIMMTSQQLNSLEDRILKINQQLHDQHNKNTLIRIFLVELLSIFYENSILIKKQLSYPPIVNQILESISLNFRERLNEILSKFEYDKAYLSRLFKSSLGITMSQYLVNVRLDYVASQLKLTDKTIFEISIDSGFYSVSHLNKIFKNKFGVTPSQFKKKQ